MYRDSRNLQKLIRLIVFECLSLRFYTKAHKEMQKMRTTASICVHFVDKVYRGTQIIAEIDKKSKQKDAEHGSNASFIWPIVFVRLTG